MLNRRKYYRVSCDITLETEENNFQVIDISNGGLRIQLSDVQKLDINDIIIGMLIYKDMEVECEAVVLDKNEYFARCKFNSVNKQILKVMSDLISSDRRVHLNMAKYHLTRSRNIINLDVDSAKTIWRLKK